MKEERVWQRGREREGRKEDLFRGNSTADGSVFFFFFFFFPFFLCHCKN